MNLFRTLSAVALSVFASAAFTSCLQAPDYPDTPQISENALTVFRKSTSQLGLRDSIEIALDFKDGNGDLGLGDADTTGLYSRRGSNRYYNNYFIQAFYKNASTGGSFLPFLGPSAYVGRFPRLTTDEMKEGPIKGVLRYSVVISLLSPPTTPGTEMRFQVSIADRATHESNVITTSTVVL
jgi:hypothetical protein